MDKRGLRIVAADFYQEFTVRVALVRRDDLIAKAIGSAALFQMPDYFFGLRFGNLRAIAEKGFSILAESKRLLAFGRINSLQNQTRVFEILRRLKTQICCIGQSTVHELAQMGC